MSYVKARGIVIKHNDVGDADKLLTILTDSKGKINVWAKGARRQRSRFLASSQLFCVSDFVFYKSKESWHLNSAQVVETFFNLRKDIKKLCYSSYLLQIVNDTIQEEQSDPDTLRLLLNTLYFLANSKLNSELLVYIFEIRFMVIQGFRPDFNLCNSCGRSILDILKQDDSGFFFNMEKGIVFCSSCQVPAKELFPLSTGAALALFHIINAPMEKLFRFNVADTVLGELSAFARSYIVKHLQKDFRSNDILSSFEL